MRDPSLYSPSYVILSATLYSTRWTDSCVSEKRLEEIDFDPQPAIPQFFLILSNKSTTIVY